MVFKTVRTNGAATQNKIEKLSECCYYISIPREHYESIACSISSVDGQGTFNEDYFSWKTVVDATVTKGHEKKVRLFDLDSLIRKGKELLARAQLPARSSEDTESVISESAKDDIRRLTEKLQIGYREQRKRIHDELSSSQTQKDVQPITVGKKLSTIKNRYGKWKVLLETKRSLRDFFYQEGSEGLNLFG